MRSFGLALAIASAMVLLSGCGLLGISIGVNTNIPIHSNIVTVVNSTSVDLEIVVNGKPITCLSPGGYYPVNLRNLDTRPATVSFMAIGRDKNGNFVGVASTSRSVSGYYQNSDSWPIHDHDLR